MLLVNLLAALNFANFKKKNKKRLENKKSLKNVKRDQNKKKRKKVFLHLWAIPSFRRNKHIHQCSKRIKLVKSNQVAFCNACAPLVQHRKEK